MGSGAALVVDDDEDIRLLIDRILATRCDRVDLASDGARAIELLRERQYDVAILDLMLPAKNGFEVAEVIRSLETPPRMIVISALTRYFHDRFPPGTALLQKPFEVADLRRAFDEIAPPSQAAARESAPSR